jgi:hypothetical protein
MGGGALARAVAAAGERVVDDRAWRGVNATAANKVAAQAAAATIRVVVRVGLAIHVSGAGS